jgi:hypothetical protein
MHIAFGGKVIGKHPLEKRRSTRNDNIKCVLGSYAVRMIGTELAEDRVQRRALVPQSRMLALV